MPPDLVEELSAMARDFATVVHSGRGPSDRRAGMAQQGNSARRQRVEASPLEPLRPSDIIRGIGPASGFSAARPSRRKTVQFTSRRPRKLTSGISIEFCKETLSKLAGSLQGLRFVSSFKKLDGSFRTLAGVFVAAVIAGGAIFVWPAHDASVPSPAAQPTGSAKVDRVTTAATSLQMAQQQLETVARDLATVRLSVQQLAARDEQNSRDIAKLQAAKEPTAQNSSLLQTLIDKQKQMVQDIAMLHRINDDLRRKLSSVGEAVSRARPKKTPVVVARQAVAQSTSEGLPAPVGLPFLDDSR